MQFCMINPTRLISTFFPLFLLFTSATTGATPSCLLKSFDSRDNVITTTKISSSDADSTLTYANYFSEQDATKTHFPGRFPFPPEPPRDDNIIQIQKCSTRFDNKKFLISPKRVQQIFIALSIPEMHPPGQCTVYLPMNHFRNEVLRI